MIQESNAPATESTCGSGRDCEKKTLLLQLLDVILKTAACIADVIRCVSALL